MSINNHINDQEVTPRNYYLLKYQKMQLWMNQSKTKYAISFENELQYLAVHNSYSRIRQNC
jgi:hypothetical protein